MPTVTEMLRGAIVGLLVERPAAKKSLQKWAVTLEESFAGIDGRAARAKNPDQARTVLRHIIGIERWGQSRLRVALGDALLRDEYDSYCPSATLTQDEMRTEFRKTRDETIAIVHKLSAANAQPERKILHNSLGEITLLGWLRYLDFHSRTESKRIR